MYNTVLLVHSWVRWIVLLSAFAAVFSAWRGLLGGKSTPGGARGVSRLFVISMDIQFLLGMALYAVLSPITQAAFSNFGAAMKDSVLRFFAMEHLLMGLVALALAHIGNARAKKAATPAKSYKQQAIFFTLSLLVILATIPWPGRAMGRVLFRL